MDRRAPSDMERIAEKAARESQRGQAHRVSSSGSWGRRSRRRCQGVATYGAYVAPPDNTGRKGLIPCKNLVRSNFALDPVQHRLTGQDTERVVSPGAAARRRLLPIRVLGA